MLSKIVVTQNYFTTPVILTDRALASAALQFSWKLIAQRVHEG